MPRTVTASIHPCGAQDVAKDLGILWHSQMTMINHKFHTCARYLYCKNVVELENIYHLQF